MFREADGVGFALADEARERTRPRRWGVVSETGRLTDVLVAAPADLAMIPCNAATRQSLANGLVSSPATASRQHRDLVRALEQAGVRCHFVAPAAHLADLTFTRDAVVMSAWGLIELRPSAAHRRAEPRHVAAAVARIGAPWFARVESGAVEGGDVCLLRDGLLVIGRSGDRTDETGAGALAAIFERLGWDVVDTRFDPGFLHLDTLFTMVSPDCAVACTEVLEDGFLARIRRLGIEIIPASIEEVRSLGVNMLCLGAGRLLAPAANRRLNRILAACGFDVITVEIDEFTRCGGGIHCLTMPLARDWK